MVNFWRPTVVCLRFLAPFPVTPSGLGNQQSDLLTSVDWRTSKELWREKPQPMGDWVELAGASALPRGARGPLSLRAESPVCAHLQHTHTDACQRNGNISSLLFPEKATQREELLIKCMTPRNKPYFRAMLEMNQCQLFCVCLREWFQVLL